MSGADLQTLEQPCPSQKLLVIVQHGEMSQQQLHLIRSKEVTARDLEMADVLSRKCAAHGVGVAVGIDNHGNRLVGMGLPQLFNEMGNVVELAVYVVTGQDGETAVGLIVTVCCLRQELRIGMQFIHSIAVEKVEEIFRRTVVLPEIMDVALATLLEQSQRGELGTHKREDCLLLIAKIDDAALTGLRPRFRPRACHSKGSHGKLVDDSKLQRIEILHLVDLYPRIALIVCIVVERKISEKQEILEVEEQVLSLIGLIGMGIAQKL